jgi:peptidoglycan DL-endopeptidase CwlO
MRTGAVIAVAGACATLFGASFLAANVTADEEKAPTPAAVVQEPKAEVAEAPEGRALSLTRASGLPALRRPPKPKPPPAPAPAPVAEVPDESAVEETVPVEPAPVEVAPTPEPYVAPAPDPVPTPSPPPAPDPPPTTEFWDSG